MAEVITLSSYSDFFLDINVRYLSYLLQANEQMLLAYYLKHREIPSEIASLLYESLGRQDPAVYFGVLRSASIATA